MTFSIAGRVPITEAGYLRDPYIQDDDALIFAAEDFTVSINTISHQLYSNYRDDYQAGKWDNDYFVVMSQMGLGDAERPILKAHYLNHINNMDSLNHDVSSIWAENVAIIEDFQKDEKSERLYLSFSSFCQGLGDSTFDRVTGSLQQVANQVGGVFPSLVPYTSLGTAALQGINNIIKKILDATFESEVKTVEFTFYPAEQNRLPNIGEAPLQTGAYAFFFEEVELESLWMERDGTITSKRNEQVSPYIVVNIKKGITLAPSQIEKHLAAEVLQTYTKSYSDRLNATNPSVEYFSALEKLGKTIRLSTATQRYFELRRKGTQLSEFEANRMKSLYDYLKENLSDFEQIVNS